MTGPGADPPIGAILAGGASRRMGIDKALVRVSGVPMIERVAAALGAVVAESVVVGRAGALAGLPAVPDATPEPRGPLAGLVAALRHAAGRAVVLVAVDQPFARPETLGHLIDLHAAAPDAAIVPLAGGVRQVTCAVYPGSLLTEAAAEDAAGGSIQSLLDRTRARIVDAAEWRSWGEDGRSWHSIDTPDAVRDAESRFG